MIQNIKHKNDLITIDFNLKQIRVVKEFNNQDSNKRDISFIDLSDSDLNNYEHLLNCEEKEHFLIALSNDLANNFKEVIVNLNELEIL
jgi:hypothetical protein